MPFKPSSRSSIAYQIPIIRRQKMVHIEALFIHKLWPSHLTENRSQSRTARAAKCVRHDLPSLAPEIDWAVQRPVEGVELLAGQAEEER